MTHIFVQFHWRQHLSPKAHPSSDSQPVVDSHVGMGFGAGHVPGRVPEKKKSKIKVVDLFLCITTGFLKARKGKKKKGNIKPNKQTLICRCISKYGLEIMVRI